MGDAVAQWLHLMAAITWVGGMIFTAAILQPVIRKSLAPDARLGLYEEIGRRFKTVMWICLILLLVTGAYRLRDMARSPEILQSSWGAILGVKLALVAASIVLSFLHTYLWGPQMTALRNDPGNSLFQPLLSRLAFWGKVNLTLVVAIVLCAALLRIRLF